LQTRLYYLGVMSNYVRKTKNLSDWMHTKEPAIPIDETIKEMLIVINEKGPKPPIEVMRSFSNIEKTESEALKMRLAGLSFRLIGEHLGITRERARQLGARATRKIEMQWLLF